MRKNMTSNMRKNMTSDMRKNMTSDMTSFFWKKGQKNMRFYLSYEGQPPNLRYEGHISGFFWYPVLRVWRQQSRRLQDQKKRNELQLTRRNQRKNLLLQDQKRQESRKRRKKDHLSQSQKNHATGNVKRSAKQDRNGKNVSWRAKFSQNMFHKIADVTGIWEKSGKNKRISNHLHTAFWKNVGDKRDLNLL